MPATNSVRDRLDELFRERIVIFDGSVGVLIQRKGLTEEDFRGERFKNHPRPLRNDVDVLCLTRPDIVAQVHRDYLEAGADLITTNTFTATPISQADYGLESFVYEMNRRGAEIARAEADRFDNRFVAGSLGPTNVTLSLSPKVDDPSFREITFDELRDGYAEAARGLRDGGADFLLIETIFDTLNSKAAIAAAREVAPELPIFISVTIVDRAGRNLSGQTVEAFWTSVEHAQPFAAGVNCSLGATEMRPYIADMSRVSPVYVYLLSERGLPNAMGGYDEKPNMTSSLLREFAESGFLNAAGGCCGTTPEHIRQIKAAMADLAPRELPAPAPHTRFSGLEPFEITPESGFVTIGERTNITGSQRFRRLIESGDFTRRGAGRARPGARRRQPAGREHGRRPPRLGGGDGQVPEPHRDRARDRAHPDHGRQLEVDRARGRPQVPAGQGRVQLDQPQGRRGGIPRQGAQGARLRGRRGRDGLRRDRARPTPSNARSTSACGPSSC